MTLQPLNPQQINRLETGGHDRQRDNGYQFKPAQNFRRSLYRFFGRPVFHD